MLYENSTGALSKDAIITLKSNYDEYDFLVFLAGGGSTFSDGLYKHAPLFYAKDFKIGEKFMSNSQYDLDDNAVWIIHSKNQFKIFALRDYYVYKIYGIKFFN